MNDIALLGPGEVLTRRVLDDWHMRVEVSDTTGWYTRDVSRSEYTCLACLLTVGKERAWRYWSWPSDDNEVGAAVARNDFAQHLILKHSYTFDFAVTAMASIRTEGNRG